MLALTYSAFEHKSICHLSHMLYLSPSDLAQKLNDFTLILISPYGRLYPFWLWNRPVTFDAVNLKRKPIEKIPCLGPRIPIGRPLPSHEKDTDGFVGFWHFLE